MRTLRRNKQTVFYALYLGIEDMVEGGYKTGEKAVLYGSPMRVKMNVSAARGNAEVEQFGIQDTYSKTIITDDMNCPINTDSILWIGIAPDANGESGAVKHNYKVVRVAKSLNSITYAVEEVKVS